MPRRTPLTPAARAVEIHPAQLDQPLPLAELWPTVGPLEVDLGCGDGTFLAAMAELHPTRNFLGVERLLGRVRSASKKIATRRLPNARLLRVDLALALSVLLSPGSVAACHLLFPDPWPKRRHHLRRTVTPTWLRAVLRILQPDGTLRLVTDDAFYFAAMQRSLAQVPELAADPATNADEYPATRFEQQFRALGKPIHRVVCRKV